MAVSIDKETTLNLGKRSGAKSRLNPIVTIIFWTTAGEHVQNEKRRLVGKS